MNPHSHTLKIVFGILGNIIGVGVGLAPVGTFRNIYKKKDTQGFSGLPYVVSLVSALVWTLYGLPWVTGDATLVVTINVATSAMQICYLTIFLRCAPKKPKMQIIITMAACFVFYATLAVLTLTVVPIIKRPRTVGSIGVALGAISYATPLSVAAEVVRSRSVKYLPIVLCICMFINSTIWTCYGIITRDIFLLLPNGLGVVFGVAQLSLYLYYRNAEPLEELPKSVAGTPIKDVGKPMKDDGKTGKDDRKPMKDNPKPPRNVKPTPVTPLEKKEKSAPASVPLNEAPHSNEVPGSNAVPHLNQAAVQISITSFTFYTGIVARSEFS